MAQVRIVEIDATKEAYLDLPGQKREAVNIIMQAIKSAYDESLSGGEAAMVVYFALEALATEERDSGMLVLSIKHSGGGGDDRVSASDNGERLSDGQYL